MPTIFRIQKQSVRHRRPGNKPVFFLRVIVHVLKKKHKKTQSARETAFWLTLENCDRFNADNIFDYRRLSISPFCRRFSHDTPPSNFDIVAILTGRRLSVSSGARIRYGARTSVENRKLID